jgi:ParB/RepB/Spo0J family partition protein
MAKEVVLIDVDDLGIDTANIRGGEWDYDKEFVQDIKNNGINNPLHVRPADPSTGVKYAIVCGSRRYNAAIEAGLTEVPCFIEEMDDVTAMGRSIAENIYARTAPAWRYAVKIGEMYEQLNHKGKKIDIVKIIMEKTGFSRTSVVNYLDIAGLPGEIIELMKEPEKRSELVKELLKQTSIIETKQTLSVEKAVKIARELRGFPMEKMFEVATYVIRLTKEVAFGIIEKVKTYPRKTMAEIHGMVTAIPKGARWVFEFGSHIVMALDEACMRKNIDRKTLVVRYVEEGLRRDGFL